MQEKRQRKRIYVRVNSDFDPTGFMQPRAVIWSDGRVFSIEEIRDFRPAATISPDLAGDCYTVIINGEEKHLFFERGDDRFPCRFGRWFVENRCVND